MREGIAIVLLTCWSAGAAVNDDPSVSSIEPAASLESVGPSAVNAGLTVNVAITGEHTNFVEGGSRASFGAGIAVGGGAEGSSGPVAVPGLRTVSVTTGSTTLNLTNGFTVSAAVAVVNIDMTSAAPLAEGFSGFNDSYLLDGVEYWDPKYIPFVQALKPGWIRFPGGTTTMAFDWQGGHENTSWIEELAPKVDAFAIGALENASLLTQAKGGGYLANFITFCQTVSARAILDFNAWTDTNPNSAQLMVEAAQAAGLGVEEWELANEPYLYPGVFPTANSYASAMFQPDYSGIHAAAPNATTGLFYEGQFSGSGGDYQTWDAGMSAYSPRYWQGVSMHIYPVTDATLTTAEEEQTLNGILAHGTNEYFNSYVIPLTGANTPLFLTELNSDTFGTLAFENYIYSGIFLAEYIARVSTVPNMQAVGVNSLFLGNDSNFGMIRAVNDFQSYLIAQVRENPSYSTDTSTNPNTQFRFYNSANALALQILNAAINSSNGTWVTTVTGGPTVPILGYDSQPIPALFAQGYQGTDGTHYMIVTNKSNVAAAIGIEVNGVLGPASETGAYLSSTSATTENTANDQTALQVVNTTFRNPMRVGPYSVTRVEW
jgi:hypothetical protein